MIRPPIIVAVDDDPDFLDFLKVLLGQKGYAAETAGTAREGFATIQRLLPSLALIDMHLPDATGLELCRRLKQAPETRQIPVIILTGMASRKSWLVSLRYGADLFLPKPCPQEDILESVEALLARRPRGKAIRVGGFSIDPDRHLVTIGDRRIGNLTAKPFDLAYLLIHHRPRVLSRAEILRGLRIPLRRDNEVNVLIHHLRRPMGEEGRRLFSTVPGRGYRFNEAAALAIGRD